MESDDLTIRELTRASAWLKLLFFFTTATGFGLSFVGMVLLYG